MVKAQIKAKPELKVVKEGEIPHLLIPGEMGAVLELTVKDKNGKVTDHRVMRSKSFLRQFLELLWIQAFQIPEVAPYSVRDVNNLLVDICESGFTFAADGDAGVVTHGIIVGTGTTAPTIDNYAIETLIAHGVGAGQLQYSAVAFGAPASDATTSQFTVTRDFANASGGAITVNEIGLYVKGYKFDVTYYFMTIRDVIAGGISVPDGQTLTVNYREQAVV
ncbi:unnamed protein product [marine sediment metagenome]|uniref:Uncharacterized protein n=1 Tax=marine sediment metagenome TaxID=412755 RepID=X1Q2P8_9ZZZZ